jgi:P27 family predicted phage terminase small subunit
MMARGTLRIGDLPVVAAYAQAQIDVREAQKEIDRLGLVLVSEDRYGNPKHEANPAVKIRKDAANQVSTLALMLGFTPLGRKRLKGEETPPKSDLDKFMEGLSGDSKA